MLTFWFELWLDHWPLDLVSWDAHGEKSDRDSAGLDTRSVVLTASQSNVRIVCKKREDCIDNVRFFRFELVWLGSSFPVSLSFSLSLSLSLSLSPLLLAQEP